MSLETIARMQEATLPDGASGRSGGGSGATSPAPRLRRRQPSTLSFTDNAGSDAASATLRGPSTPAGAELVSQNLDAIIRDTLTRQELHIGGYFTGPKGVLADFAFHSSLERERARVGAKDAERAAAPLQSGWLQRELSREAEAPANDASGTFPVPRAPDEPAAESKDAAVDALLDVSGDGSPVLREWRARRLAELAAIPSLTRKTFGHLVTLKSQAEFVPTIDCEPITAFVIIHLYEPDNPASRRVQAFLPRLARHYPYHKFVSARASMVDPSMDLAAALPVIQVYRRGSLVANLVHFTDEMGLGSVSEPFEFEDLESLLMQHGVLSMEDIVPLPSDAALS